MTPVSMPVSALTDRDVRLGGHSVELAGSIAGELDARRVLLVRGKASFTASGAHRLLPGLEQVAKVEQWSDFAPNTDAADLLAGLRLVERFDPDLVLAVGGGSAMDMAKLLCALRGVTDADDLHRRIRRGEPATERGTALVLAPTTSGSGSEATRFAVVYIGDQKYSIGGPQMLPDAVILDPALSLSGSRYQRATSGADAVAQAIESLWAGGATGASRDFARPAVGLLLTSIDGFVNAPSLASARPMMLGAHLAGRAIDTSKTTAAHALSYGITKRFGLSHGHAVGVTLGAFIEAHAAATADRLQPGIDPSVHTAVMAEILAAFDASDGPAARAAFDAMLHRIGLDPRLSSIDGVAAEDRQQLAATVNAERLSNNPVPFNRAELTKLLLALD